MAQATWRTIAYSEMEYQANAATLAGSLIEDNSNVGAYSGVHQFCRVGREAYIGGYS